MRLWKLGGFFIALSLFPFPLRTPAALGWGGSDIGIERSLQIQSSIIRRVATAAEIHAALKNAKAIVAAFTPEKKAQLKKEKVRYIAVKPTIKDTPADNTASAKGNTDVMVYDIIDDTTVNKYVYTVNGEPSVGSTVKLDGFDSLYVGN